MNNILKSKSPFYPGQPVPVELFVGRKTQIGRIRQRGIGQVRAGKPIAMFVEGEYGIGKSSMANLAQKMAGAENDLFGIYAPLAFAGTVDDVGSAVLKAVLNAGSAIPTVWDRFRNYASKFIKEISLFGITFRTDAVQQEGPNVGRNMLGFLNNVLEQVKPARFNGIFLVLDEINGITNNPQFAHLIKGLVDENALARTPLPLLLMLCGVEERRREMIRCHQPVDRIFDIVSIEALNEEEMREFFTRAFDSANMTVDADAMSILTHWSAGFPKIMHLVGDAAFWLDKDGVISKSDAVEAAIFAAEEVGKKYVDQQVYKALRSRDYHEILSKIVQQGPNLSFIKSEIRQQLTPAQQKKFDNFLQRMKRLNVLRQGDERGEYIFAVRMVPMYLWLQTLRRGASHS